MSYVELLTAFSVASATAKFLHSRNLTSRPLARAFTRARLFGNKSVTESKTMGAFISGNTDCKLPVLV